MDAVSNTDDPSSRQPSTEGATKPHLEIRPLTGAIGAEIEGVSIVDGISDALADEIRNALDRHRVIFFRGQHLDDEAQIALARVFGLARDPDGRRAKERPRSRALRAPI